MRKDGVPSIAHPIAVSTLVLENGGSEDEGIIALLHDSVEEVKVTAETITYCFGKQVADVVLELSEPQGAEWRDRKLAYIEQVRAGSQSAVLVSLADKTHNAQSYLKGARLGAKDDSQSKTDQTLWFLGELAKVYRDRMVGELGEKLTGYYLVELLERTIEELRILWRGGTAHIVDGEFYNNACEWEREFSGPDYPETEFDAPCLEDFSRNYWNAVRDKTFWFEAPNSEQQPIQLAQPIELLYDINIRYYESGEVFANVPVRINEEELVIEVWNRSAEWLSSYASKGTTTLIDILKTDVVEGVRVVQARITESKLLQSGF